MIAFEKQISKVSVKIKDYYIDNDVYTTKQILHKLQTDKQTLRACGVSAHHQNGIPENSIKNISKKIRIYMFHVWLRWPDIQDKTLWSLAMEYAVYVHNHIPKIYDGRSFIEYWIRYVLVIKDSMAMVLFIVIYMLYFSWIG